jgi:hypothetical protein
MARTALTPVDVASNTSTADPAGTSLDATNSHVFTPTSPLHEYFIRVTNTTASTKTLTVKAGDNPPADAAGQGDLVVSLTAGNVTTQVKWIGPLTSARFIQNDGTVNLDVAASMTGTITVFRLPRDA